MIGKHGWKRKGIWRKWFEMAGIVCLLGAGASAGVGAPVMSNFFDKARSLYFKNKVPNEKKCFENVFKAIAELQKTHSKTSLDIHNLETVFTAIEMGRLLGAFPGYKKEDIDNLEEDFKTVIVKVLEESMFFPKEILSTPISKTYDELAKLTEHVTLKSNPKLDVTFLTFNYDVALEVSLQQKDLYADYMLSGSARNDTNYVKVLKLHGSINWAEKDSGEILSLSMADHPAQKSWHTANMAGQRFCRVGSQLQTIFNDKGDSVKPTPVIVPPSWNKFSRYQQLSSVWSSAALSLGNASHIFVLGYSMPETDSFFKTLFALGSYSGEPLSRFVVLDLSERAGLVDNRFESFLGAGARYEYISGDLEVTANSLAKILQNDGLW